jgi:hypothetical protein
VAGAAVRFALPAPPYQLVLPSRVRALVSAVGFLWTSILFAFVHAGCAHVSRASRTSQRLTSAYLTFVHSQSLQPCPPPPLCPLLTAASTSHTGTTRFTALSSFDCHQQ